MKIEEMNYEGAVGIHELMTFYGKATPEEEQQLEHCMRNRNVDCVKSLVAKVTGMEMDKISEMIELSADLQIRKKYVEYAKNAVRDLKILKQIKDRTTSKSEISNMIRQLHDAGKIKLMFITRSGVESILVGLGERNQFSTLSPADKKIALELENLLPEALTWNDKILSKLTDLL